MKDNRKLILPVVLLTMALSATAQAENEKLFYTFGQLKNQNGWLNSQNAAGLATYGQENFTQAAISGVFTEGSLRNVYDPVKENDYRLNVRSYRRLNDVMLYGQIVFDYDLKKDQQWTSMTYPGSSPLHIADKTPGTQTCETYFIDGGIGVPVGAGFTFGGYFDFKGVSNAKKKDIRNKNNFSIYHLKPSVMWEKGNFRLGANYSFGSETEKIEWLVYGDKMQHEVFFFEGLWFGPSEITSASVTDRRFERSLQEGAMQLEYASNTIRLFNQLRVNKEQLDVYLKVDEERGGENKKAGYVYDGQLWMSGALFNHSLKWHASHGFVKSYQNLQQREMVNYVYQYVQYGTILRYTQSDWNTGLSYELLRMRDKAEWRQNWRLLIESGFSYREQKFRAYPTVFSQQIRQAYVTLGFDKNLLFSSGMLDLGIKACWQTGWGDPLRITDPESTNGYKYQEELQQAEYAYLTAQTLGTEVSVKYTWFQNPTYGFAPFAKASYVYREATNRAAQDKSRSHIEFALGLNF